LGFDVENPCCGIRFMSKIDWTGNLLKGGVSGSDIDSKFLNNYDV
jgi:hypothetical protein